MQKIRISTLLAIGYFSSYSYAIDTPAVHPRITTENDKIVLINGEQRYPLRSTAAEYTLAQMMGNPVGTDTGIRFDFGKINGKLHYGFIKLGDSHYPQPVFFKNVAAINDGQANINIAKDLAGRYDSVNWAKTGAGLLGYRVATTDGTLLYDGKIAFLGKGPFQVNQATIVEGPLVHFDTDGHFYRAVRLSFETFTDTTAIINVATRDGKLVSGVEDRNLASHHEVTLTRLTPDTDYRYEVVTSTAGGHVYRESYTFKTAPAPGSRKPVTFAYASDGRKATGGGERDLGGVNGYILKKIVALAQFKGAKFLQFTGDLINGYVENPDHAKVQYRNWKRVVEPFAHTLPIVTGIGNHEVIMSVFDDGSKNGLQIDRFPYATNSSEAIFAGQVVNPTNGPASEDGAVYDPDPQQVNFPSYQENVFYYIYDNVAMVVLNSDYWYAPSLKNKPQSGGNLHGYLLDNQLDWLKKTLELLDTDENIDFVFVTQHTPAFPNGGHVGDDMWYDGNNDYRAIIQSPADGTNLVARGIIEQRDKFLQILMQSKKVSFMLTGDEHNFNFMKIGKNVEIYPKNWDKADIRQNAWFRELWQVNNGAAGAPYYAQEETPWTSSVQSFTTQNALVFFHIDGRKLTAEVINPDTLDYIYTSK